MCECTIHRYHCAHVCECGQIASHSQSSWDYHKFHGSMLTFDVALYAHGDTAEDVLRKLRDRARERGDRKLEREVERMQRKLERSRRRMRRPANPAEWTRRIGHA